MPMNSSANDDEGENAPLANNDGLGIMVAVGVSDPVRPLNFFPPPHNLSALSHSRHKLSALLFSRADSSSGGC
jgi:hypothetical protein